MGRKSHWAINWHCRECGPFQEALLLVETAIEGRVEMVKGVAPAGFYSERASTGMLENGHMLSGAETCNISVNRQRFL